MRPTRTNCNRMSYTGKTNSKGEPHGQGRMILPGGATYAGDWKDGEWHGQ